MTTLVVGASGATGRLLVKQLLDRGESVRIIVRDKEKLTEDLMGHKKLDLLEAKIENLNKTEWLNHVNHCDAIASCLGHNPNFKGIFGHPRRLVADATQQLCESIKSCKRNKRVKYVLMNTTGNRNLDRDEPSSFWDELVLALFRRILPPHVDNEMAAKYLRTEIGQKDDAIEWAAVRPYNLINFENLTDYHTHHSPIKSAIFDSRVTSRINVAHFMADLILEDDIWSKWKGQMPIIYDSSKSKK